MKGLLLSRGKTLREVGDAFPSTTGEVLLHHGLFASAASLRYISRRGGTRLRFDRLFPPGGRVRKSRGSPAVRDGESGQVGLRNRHRRQLSIPQGADERKDLRLLPWA